MVPEMRLLGVFVIVAAAAPAAAVVVVGTKYIPCSQLK